MVCKTMKIRSMKKAHSTVLQICTTTERFLASERYSFTDQIRRSATPQVANIVEGGGKFETKFCKIS